MMHGQDEWPHPCDRLKEAWRSLYSRNGGVTPVPTSTALRSMLAAPDCCWGQHFALSYPRVS